MAGQLIKKDSFKLSKVAMDIKKDPRCKGVIVIEFDDEIKLVSAGLNDKQVVFLLREALLINRSAMSEGGKEITGVTGVFVITDSIEPNGKIATKLFQCSLANIYIEFAIKESILMVQDKKVSTDCDSENQ